MLVPARLPNGPQPCFTAQITKDKSAVMLLHTSLHADLEILQMHVASCRWRSRPASLVREDIASPYAQMRQHHALISDAGISGARL